MRINILNNMVNLISINSLISKIVIWISDTAPKGRYVCVSNVHMTMLSFDDVKFQNTINNSDLTVPDGMPLVWAQKLLGYSTANQVRGYDLTIAVCELASRKHIPIGIYGSTENIIIYLKIKLLDLFPDINIVYAFSPPFRELKADEEDQYIQDINNSKAKILLVGLGCPKQEIWMAKHKERLSCVMLGVGAAFDFITNNKKHAPKIMQIVGLEWLFRLLSEPRRLWRRYLNHNPRFIWYFSKQLLRDKFKIKS